ncbi:helix-turn-helix transcriptional regulator [Streptomyces olivaceus]|uniref:helix-turn-helix transcriptional regulator n=1 Tax=Streptomyces olivaceus TaxID=47716 RepID=UPI0018A84CDD|nr:AAA family ATPase [Streptomyces olivaceus]MBF8171668.1 helix-turn-helix transcriptional regulator [Streptomyces olivaceus]
MARTRAAVRGRDQELTALRTALAPDGGRLIVLTGPAGIGRTALLDRVARLLAADGARVLPLRLGTGPDGGGDPYALAALVRAVRERFEQLQESGLSEALSAVAQLRDARGRERGGWTPAVVAALDGLFETVGRRERVALLVDDAHAVAEPAPVLSAARRAGCLVVATCEEGAERGPGLAELLTDADRVMTIGPLADDVALSLVRRAAGARLDESVVTALRTALGPLLGNPGTVLGTLDALRRSGRLVTFEGRLCLSDPAEPVALPADHPLLRRASALGGTAVRLLGAVALLDGLDLDALPPLADILEADPVDCGRGLDLLIEAGVLTAGPDGRISCRCPALAATAAGRFRARRGTALHAALAERLLAGHRRSGGVDPVVLADHVARGGATVRLDDDTVRLLLTMGAAAEQEEPERATLWYSAALRRLPPTGPEHARTLCRLLLLVVRTGRYELLREPLTRYAEHGCAEESVDEIRLAAVLLALHSGVPPAERAVRELLDAPFPGRGPTAFSEWWFDRRLAPDPRRHPATDGDTLAGAGAGAGVDTQAGAESRGWAEVTAEAGALAADGAETPAGGKASVGGGAGAGDRAGAGARDGTAAGDGTRGGAGRSDLLSAALCGDVAACERVWRSSGGAAPSPELDRLRQAALVADMADVARLVIGADYRVPETGVLGAYHRVVRGYADADWTRAMSAVRELELSPAEDTLARHAARLLAVDMCAARGEFGQAARWLTAATRAPRLAVLRTWARVGLAARKGDDGQAVRVALLAGPRLRRAGLRTGLSILLSRALRIAVLGDDHEGAAELLAEIELLPHEHHVDAQESLLLARGLVHRDPECAREATDLIRERGDLPALMESCLAVARFAPDPRPWLREAHALATRCGAAALLERVREVTRERGVPAPRARGRRDALAVTEQRIIELIGEGLTNRQIALRLRLSEKTVENYLTRLFARTGCRSRVELAAASLTGRLARTPT